MVSDDCAKYDVLCWGTYFALPKFVCQYRPFFVDLLVLPHFDQFWCILLLDC